MSRPGGNPIIGHYDREIHNNGNGENATLPNAFHGALDPGQVFQRETPAHRRMAALATEGYTCKEIAQALGFCQRTVSLAIRQPHAQRYMIESIATDSHTAIRQALEAAAPDALKRILDVASDETLRAKDPKTFIQANQEVLNRFLGKPSQPLEHSHNVNPNQLTDEELERIATTGRPVTTGP